jgi:hypothetical protein
MVSNGENPHRIEGKRTRRQNALNCAFWTMSVTSAVSDMVSVTTYADLVNTFLSWKLLPESPSLGHPEYLVPQMSAIFSIDNYRKFKKRYPTLSFAEMSALLLTAYNECSKDPNNKYQAAFSVINDRHIKLLGRTLFDARTTVDLSHGQRPHVVEALIDALGDAQGRDRLQMRTFLLCGGRMNPDGTYKSNAFSAVCTRMPYAQTIFDFARTSALKTLRLFNTIDDKGATALAGMLCTNTTLTKLNLSGNNDIYLGSHPIGNEGVTALAGMLRTNTTLTTLSLWGNAIGNEGATALAGMLHTNTTLTTLNLGDNAIGNEGATALAGMLHTNTTLTTLNLGDNGIGHEGATVLAGMLHTNTTLTKLYLI